jgi:hypothetical protein
MIIVLYTTTDGSRNDCFLLAEGSTAKSGNEATRWGTQRGRCCLDGIDLCDLLLMTGIRLVEFVFAMLHATRHVVLGL